LVCGGGASFGKSVMARREAKKQLSRWASHFHAAQKAEKY